MVICGETVTPEQKLVHPLWHALLGDLAPLCERSDDPPCLELSRGLGLDQEICQHTTFSDAGTILYDPSVVLMGRLSD